MHSPRSITCRILSNPISDGTMPDILFFGNVSFFNSLNLPTSVGIKPVNRFSPFKMRCEKGIDMKKC